MEELNPTTMEITFHYGDIELEPYKDGEKSTSDAIIKKIFNQLQEDASNGKYHVLDRKQNQNGSDKRRLVMIGVTNTPNRRYGKLALIKNKAPYFMDQKFDLDIIENEINKDYVEVTHFYVDTTGLKPILMIEFNSEGPRVSDIEYYIRHLGKQYKFCKYCSIKIHVKGEVEEIVRNLKNVFRIDMKVRADKSIFYKEIDDSYISSMNTLKKNFPYQDIRIDVGFGYKKKLASNGYETNIGGLVLGRKIMDFINKKNENIEYLESLKMNVDMGNGPELIDFISNKEHSALNIKLASKDRPESKDLRIKATAEFDEYIAYINKK